MKVSVDVYTKDVEAGLAAFKLALDSGATDAQLRSNEDWETKKFESLNLMFKQTITAMQLAILTTVLLPVM